jgi:hypothetical protein
VEVAQFVHCLDGAEHLHAELACGEHGELAAGLLAAQLGDVLAQ